MEGWISLTQKQINLFITAYNANDSTSISNNLVRAIYEDRQGTLWIGTGVPVRSEVGQRKED